MVETLPLGRRGVFDIACLSGCCEDPFNPTEDVDRDSEDICTVCIDWDEDLGNEVDDKGSLTDSCDERLVVFWGRDSGDG